MQKDKHMIRRGPLTERETEFVTFVRGVFGVNKCEFDDLRSFFDLDNRLHAFSIECDQTGYGPTHPKCEIEIDASGRVFGNNRHLQNI